MEKKNFALYKEKELVFTNGGTFASDAWIASNGENFGDVSGEKFDCYDSFGDNVVVSRYDISPISEAELEEKFKEATPIFKLLVELCDLPSKRKMTVGNRIKLNHILCFNMLPSLFTQFENSEEKVREIIEDYVFGE